MAIAIELSNLVGFEGLDPDVPEDGTAGLLLPTVREGQFFSVDITFFDKQIIADPESGVESEIITPATEVEGDYNFDQYGLSLTIIDADTVRLSGPIQDAFPDQYYRFVMPDLSLQIHPPNIDQPFFSLQKYKMPDPTYILLSYGFIVTVGTPQEVTVSQWVYWDYQTAVDNITRLVDIEGLK